ncbi:MAG: DUF2007 domain-containing protein [Planctomycetota bacterium]
MENAEPVALLTVNSKAEAEVIANALRAQGINAVAEPDLEALGEFPITGCFSARVLVAQEHVEAAKRIIRSIQTHDGEAAADN